MKRSVLYYSVAMAALLFMLRVVDYRYRLYDMSTEFYLGVVALFFTSLGLWAGRKLTANRPNESKAVLQPIVSAVPIDIGISPRETEILRLIAAGHSNQEIADSLFLSLNTVKKHTSALLRKLEAERRTQAVQNARTLGLIE